jgi:hypothetical protein
VGENFIEIFLKIRDIDNIRVRVEDFGVFSNLGSNSEGHF